MVFIGNQYHTFTSGNMAHLQQLYFVAIIPPAPICEEIIQLKQYFANHHQSKAALKSPPHITLHMPFKWQERKEQTLIKTVSLFCENIKQFDVSLKNFAAFPPRVIYIDVIENIELNALQKNMAKHLRLNLNLLNADYKNRTFKPHLTIAFRDLRKSEFHAAWDVFKEKNYEQSFQCDQVWLLKHDGKRWQQHKSFPLLK